MFAMGVENLSLTLRITTVVVPVGVYFLLLGLLNSRRHPQFLTGRQDFAMLVLALSPLLVLPILSAVGISALTVVLTGAGLAGGILLLAPRGRNWVVYNLPMGQARRVVEQAVESLGLSHRASPTGWHLPGEQAALEVGGFPMLRNVSLRLRGGSREFVHRFESALTSRLGALPAETSPAAVSLLLAATAMLVVPLTLVVNRAPEIVRLLTDLLR
jgi:hypothetical protein